MIVISQYAF